MNGGPVWGKDIASRAATLTQRDVIMMETPDLWNSCHSPYRARLDGSSLGGVFLERQVSSAGMIVVDVFAQDSPEVPLGEDDHVVETLAADGSDHPFDEWILPRRIMYLETAAWEMEMLSFASSP